MAAFACAVASSQWLLAAEPIATAEAPLLSPPASSRRMVVTQIVPAVQVEPQAQAGLQKSTVVPVQATAAPFPAMTPIQSPAVAAPSPPVRSAPGVGTTAPVSQAPAAVVVPVPVAPPQTTPPAQGTEPIDEVVTPPAPAYVPARIAPGAVNTPSPFLDDSGENLPVLEEQNGEFVERRGVRPYGGGHPGDWSWGCNGSPYRTGPGMCDDWKVGCRWHVTVDGIGLERRDANLSAIQAAMPDSFAPLSAADQGLVGDPFYEQFDFEPGARIAFMSQIPHVGYQVQAVYEGIPEWNSSIVYPKQALVIPPFANPPIPPNPDPFPDGTLQRSLHYRSSLHSAELNFARDYKSNWMPIFGARYIRFDDEINDFIEQEAQPPLAGPNANNQAIGPITTTDRLNLVDVQNQLTGFQVGLLHDTWRLNRRLSLEAIVNGGVYYNRVKYSNYMGIFTTQVYADNINTAAINEARVDFSDTVNNDVRELSEVSYHGEASLTGVCRLNKCWAVRGGYQVLWISNVHLAEDGYVNGETWARDLLFHGWHAGIECRR